MSAPSSSINKKMYDINAMLCRTMNRMSYLHIGMTGGETPDQIHLMSVDIRDANGASITSKLANTITHNICIALEDSKSNEKHFSIKRGKNDFDIICEAYNGMNAALTVIRQEVKNTEMTMNKCREDISRITETFGVETVEHVLRTKRSQAI